MELTLAQEEGLKTALQRYKAHEKYITISGYAGSGKAQPNDTNIPTPKGWKKLGELKIGDYVFNRHGQPVKIIGVYPQGQQEVFKVTLGDGRTTLCNDEHIWSTYSRQGNLVNHTLKELMQMGFKSGKTYKFKIPNMESINFPEQQFKVDPYVIGAFLGDGCCKQKYLTLSSENEEIPEIISQLTDFPVEKASDKNYNWNFYLPEKQEVNGYERTRPQTLEFLPYEVCQKAENKSIPPQYKYSSKEQRYALLQGLLDTDGSITTDDRYNVRFTSISYQLILDVKEILNSLGYQSVTISKDNRSEKYTSTGVCYNLNINIPNEDKPLLFRLTRKHNIALEAAKKPKRKNYDKVSIYSAEDLGYTTEMTCIMVDDEEHLYVTNDYIVTHNTTLVKFIIAALDVDESKVAYASYTGKAAEVLRKKGNSNAMTLHRLLYDSFPRPGGGFFRKPKTSLDYSVIVVDEVSMVPRSMVELLLAHRVFVIFLGDPFQLPQISKDETHDLLDHPHVFLSEIMRQAKESEIIQLTMKIRAGEEIPTGQGEDAIVIPKQELVSGHLLWAEVIICATNNTRHNINKQKRELLGFHGDLQTGERIIIKRNYWEYCDEDGNALVNGTIGTVTNPFESFVRIPKYIKNDRRDLPLIICEFTPDGGKPFSTLDIDKDFLLTEQPCVDWRVAYQLGKLKPKIGDILPKQGSYGYALTGHAAQGSEWDKVLVIEEDFPFDKLERARWLYTSCTRASEKLVLVR